MIKSKPAHLQAAMTSGRAWLISEPKSRVASERMKTLALLSSFASALVATDQGLIAFMRIRSPSSAPPLLRRLGSMLMMAMRRRSLWSKRRRRINSSVSEDLPAPPVPVMPSTGIFCSAARRLTSATNAASAWLFSSAVMSCARLRQASWL